MNVETLIYAYITICISMMIFNICCVFAFRHSERRLHVRSETLKKRVGIQLARLENGEDVEESHKKYLARKLTRVGNLMAFDELIALDMTIEELNAERRELTNKYLRSLHDVFTILALEYRNSDKLRLAYFAYLVGKHSIIKNFDKDKITGVMLSMIDEESFYCRENAMYALYRSGNVESVTKALLRIDRNQRFYHTKLLSDGLLTFTGDSAALAKRLWEEFTRLSQPIQIAVLDYLRFSTGDFCGQMLELLADSSADDEFRFSCIRYFGKYRCDEAYPLLLEFADPEIPPRWEYTAIAASALSSYPSERTISVLKRCLSDKNWYIRFNAAQSLESFGLGYTDLIDVIDGSDRYAREIIQYNFDLRRVRNVERTVSA